MKKLRATLPANTKNEKAAIHTSIMTKMGNLTKKILRQCLFAITFVLANLFMTNNAFAAIGLRGTATTAMIGGTTLTIARPTGLVINDVMIVQIVQSSNAKTLTDATATGWTKIAGSDIGSFTRSRCRATLLYKVANSMDVAAANFSFTMGTGSDNAVGGINAYSGVNPVNIFDVLPGAVYTNIINGQQLNATAITTQTANSAVIMFGAIFDNQALSTWSIATLPTATTLNELVDVQYNAALDIGMGTAWAIKATAGSTGNGTAAIAGATNPYNGAILIALKDASSPGITSLSGGNCVGSSITITGTNLTGATAASVLIGGTPVTSITSNSGTVIVAVIGAGTTGLVTVGTPIGTVVSSSPYTVNLPPAIPAISPAIATICNGSVQQLTATNYRSSPQTVGSGTISVPIPDNNPTGVASTLSLSGVPSEAVVTGVSVTFNITHTYDSDLIINLKAPNGNILNLINLKGGAGDNFTNTVISSSSSTLLSSGLAPFTGTYAADAASSIGSTAYISNVTSFSGLYSVLNGNWVLAVRDDAAVDIGTITGWSITITYTLPSVTWLPATGLYTDAGAITPYSGGAASTVYAKPSSSQTYAATVTSGNGCTNAGSAAINVTPVAGTPVTPTPSASTICQGSANTTYTTSATNSTSYTWSVTGTGNSVSGTGATGTVTWAPGFSGIATVSVTANGCGTSSPASTTVTVTPSVTPGVAISAGANPVIAGTSVTYTPTPTNGGTPAYQWWVNGSSAGTGSTYSYTPNNLDQVYVVMTSTLSCVTSSAATSGTITMTVNPVTSTTWTGISGTNWNTPGNWSPVLPGPGISVTIPVVTNKPVISTYGNKCNNLSLAAGAALTIAYNGNLTVNGNLNNAGTAANLVIQSTGSGTGSLITNGTITGTATVQRYIGGASWDWHFLSSPITAQAISGGFTPVATGFDFYSWSEPDQLWINFKNTTVTPKWSDANGASFVPGKGYLVAYEATNTTKNFSGLLNSGTINSVLTKGGTGDNQYYNLVGNPYPCSLDWEVADGGSGWDRSNLNGAVNYKSYWVMSGATGNYGTYTSLSGGTNGVTQYIGSGQGFIVLAQSTGDFTMRNGVKSHSTQTYLKKGENSNEVLRLKLNCDGNSYSDEAIVAFNNSDSDGSTEKFNSFYADAPELWTVKNGNKYSINFMGNINSDKIVPLVVKAGVAGTYTLTASQVESFGSNAAISFEDRATGTYTYLGSTPSYSFQVNATSTITDRFFLHFMDVTGIANSIATKDFNIYSAEGILNIQSLRQLGGKIAVIDILGRTIATGRIEAGATTQINMHGKTGVYIVSVLTGKGNINSKILVK